jgi:hypothetical protein
VIPTTANFQAAAAKLPLLPVYRFSIEGYARTFVYRKTGNSGEYPWITSIGDWGVSVSPQDASYTIDDLVVSVIDPAAAVTADLGLYLLETRRCTLQMGFDGLALADYTTIFSGIVNTVTSNADGTWSFTCNDYNRLNQRLVFTEGNSGTVTVATTTFNATDAYTIITEVATTNPITGVVTTTAAATYASVGPTGPVGVVTTTSGGTTTTVTTTSRVITGLGGGPFTVYETVTVITGFNTQQTITETFTNSNLYCTVTVTTVTDQVQNSVTSTVTVTNTVGGTVGTVITNDNATISSTNPCILNGHPLDMLLEILQDEIGYADSDINLTQIEAFRDTVFTGVEFYFVITGSVDAKDFIENQLLKPLGGYLFSNYLGQLCVGFAQPLSGGLTAVGGINPTNLTTLPALNVATLINVVSMRFDKNDDGVAVSTINSTGYLSQADNFYIPSIADITDLSGEVAQELVTGAGAVQGQVIIESDGMRSGFQGFLLAKMISNAIFAKYGAYNPTLQAECFMSRNGLLMATEIGEFLTLTHPLLPNRKAGVMGITNQLFQVTGRSYSFDSMMVTFTLEDASGVAAFGGRKIAPTGEAAFTAASSGDQATYLFMSNPSGKQSTGVTAGTLG